MVMYRMVITQMRQLLKHRDEIEALEQEQLGAHPDFIRL